MALALVSCGSPSGGDDEPLTGSCVTDFDCPSGEACTAGGCGELINIYNHIQIASALLRPPLNDDETQWRAAHSDVAIGFPRPEIMRPVNPNVRLFDYYNLGYHRLEDIAADWATSRGINPENFYLHYSQDTVVPSWETQVLVPGYAPGVVPGWNPAAGTGDPPASATSRDQARVVGYRGSADPGGLQPWYLPNMANPAFRDFVVYSVAGLLDGTLFDHPYTSGHLDGIMMDNAIYYPEFGEGLLDRTNEFPGVPLNESHPHAVAYELAYQELVTELPSRLGGPADVLPNYSDAYYLSYPSRFAQSIQQITPWVWTEVWITYRGYASPTSGSTRCITYEKDYDNAIAAVVRQTRDGGRRVLSCRDRVNDTVGTDRGRILSLAMYYLLHNKNTYYNYQGAPNHSGSDHMSLWSWNAAVQFDVGEPDVIPAGALDFDGRANTKEHYVWQTGPDPYDSQLEYRLLARRFTNALVLVKLLPIGSVVDDRSITTHALDGSYAVLQPDGSLGAIVTEASIRNNEGLILIPMN